MTVKEASQASIVRDFNKWNVAEGAPSKVKNSIFKGVFVVNKDLAYEFKYFIDGVFVNELGADFFKWNEFVRKKNDVLAC